MTARHWKFALDDGDQVETTVPKGALVKLMSPDHLYHYSQGQPYRCTGGVAKISGPVRVVPPSPGTWHLIVEKARNPTARVVKPRQIDVGLSEGNGAPDPDVATVLVRMPAKLLTMMEARAKAFDTEVGDLILGAVAIIVAPEVAKETQKGGATD